MSLKFYRNFAATFRKLKTWFNLWRYAILLPNFARCPETEQSIHYSIHFLFFASLTWPGTSASRGANSWSWPPAGAVSCTSPRSEWRSALPAPRRTRRARTLLGGVRVNSLLLSTRISRRATQHLRRSVWWFDQFESTRRYLDGPFSAVSAPIFASDISHHFATLFLVLQDLRTPAPLQSQTIKFHKK